MRMDDHVWRQHCNPLSGWSRMTVLPLIALAVWSRVWLGWWALPLVLAVLVWTWWNPRAFPPPARFDSWMTRGIMGERIFLTERAQLAAHHQRAAVVLGWLSLPGAVLMVWGLWTLWWEAAVFGTALCLMPKLWFLDRMAWIYQDWTQAGRQVPGLGQGAEHV